MFILKRRFLKLSVLFFVLLIYISGITIYSQDSSSMKMYVKELQNMANPALWSTEKYFLTATVVVRISSGDNFPKWTKEHLRHWINYLKFAGVQHLYLYDNYLNEEECLKYWINEEFDEEYITYIDWNSRQPYSNANTVDPARNHALQMYQNESTWQLTLNMDEFPYSELDKHPGFLRRVLQFIVIKYPLVTEIFITSVMFCGASEHEDKYIFEQVLKKLKEPSGIEYERAAYKPRSVFKPTGHKNVLAYGNNREININMLRINHYINKDSVCENSTEDSFEFDPGALEIAHKLKEMEFS